MIKRTFTLLVALFLLQACHTVSKETGPLANSYKEVISNRCVIIKSAEEIYEVSRRRIQQVSIYSIERGANNWNRIDFAANGHRSNFYHHVPSGEIVCGSKNWRKLGRDGIFDHPQDLSSRLKVSKGSATQNVLCKISLNPFGNEIQTTERKCYELQGIVLKKIGTIPEGIQGQEYINCKTNEDEKPLFVKANVCAHLNGEIIVKAKKSDQ